MENPAADRRAYRLGGIDMVRGLAVVVMALDHVRDFFLVNTVADPTADPDVGLVVFLTRWVTHFCAPWFVVLAGVSAGLMAARKSPRELGRFLASRGLWLIAVECFVISTALTFAPFGLAQVGGKTLVGMQVIWAIGASMVILSGMQFLGRRACCCLGALILVAHNVLDPHWPASGLFDLHHPLWVAWHGQMAFAVGPFLLLFIYPLLPWAGVMLFGFGLAGVFEQAPERRQAILWRSGLAMTLAFVGLRALDLYGDPNEWSFHSSGVVATAIDFLNTTKYPPSLLFLLMTLGPGALLVAFADRWRGVVKDTLVMFGRVPFAFYVAHFVLIHGLSLLLGVLQGFPAADFLTIFLFYPQGYGLGLPAVYLVWLLVVALLWPFCRWVAAVKARRSDWWLSYV